MEPAESSDDSDDEEYGRAALALGKYSLNLSNGVSGSGAPGGASGGGGVKTELGFGYDLMAKFEQTQRLSFFKRNKKHFPMFPHLEERFKVRAAPMRARSCACETLFAHIILLLV